MTKKIINNLVTQSYSGKELDEKKVEKIASMLKRKDLKSYIRALKHNEKKKEVIIALPSASIYNKTKDLFFDLFPDKRITVREDDILMLGGKITADDMVYDFSLKNKLENFLSTLESSYDEE